MPTFSSDRLIFPIVALLGAGIIGVGLGMFGRLVCLVLAACGHATP